MTQKPANETKDAEALPVPAPQPEPKPSDLAPLARASSNLPQTKVGKISGAIAAVMGEIGIVPKQGTNQFHRYRYAQMQDVLQQLTPLLAKHGLAIWQTERERSWLDGDRVVQVQYSFRISHSSGEVWPEEMLQTGVCRARDSKGGFDDKCINKCHTAAPQVFLCLALFQIPTGDVDDADEGEGRTRIATSYRQALPSHAFNDEIPYSAPDPTRYPQRRDRPPPLIRLSVHLQARVGRVPLCCGSPKSRPGRGKMSLWRTPKRLSVADRKIHGGQYRSPQGLVSKMKRYDVKPWVCHECHYVMDSTANVTGDDAAPKEGDFCLCLNCGGVYEYDWQLQPRRSNFLSPVIIAAVEMIKRRGKIK